MTPTYSWADKTEEYGGGCITLYYFWVLAFATLNTALLAGANALGPVILVIAQ